jgi:hypothetical protein
MEEDHWLDGVMIVNESASEETPGDVMVFRNQRDACGYLEDWWVRDGEGYAFTARGERVRLAAIGTSVVVDGIEPCAEGEEIVRRWLMSAASALLQARRGRAEGRKVEQAGVLPTTVEGLIAYVGFRGRP